MQRVCTVTQPGWGVWLRHKSRDELQHTHRMKIPEFMFGPLTRKPSQGNCKGKAGRYARLKKKTSKVVAKSHSH